MNFDPEPYVHACHILDPEDRLWHYQPPPHRTEVVPCSDLQDGPQTPPRKKKTVKNLKQYHQLTNEVLKNIVLELKFQNDAFRLFIFQCREGGRVDFETRPFLKLLLILQSLGISESKLSNRHHSTSGSRSRRKAMQVATGIVSERLLVLFEEYHEMKLCLESAWSIQQAVACYRNHRALGFFTTIQNALNEIVSQKPGQLYWQVMRWLKKLTSDVITMEMMVSDERRKLGEWWLVARRLAGYKETLSCPPTDRYAQLLEMVRLLDIKRRTASARMDTIAPNIDILRLQHDLVRAKEKEAKECRKCLKGIYNK